ncbi:MAG TPA: diguanylate cyclase [Candidatus Baltobacteraceae bacterium]|nr:diguanylate cyclase [Candidatus Baltobacteraceae bacterium]
MAERFLKNLIDAMPAMVAYWDAETRCRFANKAYVTWFGKSPESVIGTSIRELLGERLFAMNEPFIRGALSGKIQQFERTLVKADGSIGYTLANYIPDVDDFGAVHGFFVLVSDVTALKEAETELRIAASIISSTTEGIMVTDSRGIIKSVNPAFTAMTGHTSEEAIGKTANDFQLCYEGTTPLDLFSRASKDGHWSGEATCRRKNGDVFPVWLSVNAVDRVDGDRAGYASLVIDVTDQWQKNERIRHLAFHDALTDLPNRYLLLERLSQLCSIADREKRLIAVLFLDLDGFKAINDALGHEEGDALLKRVAATLKAQVRHTDSVARLGGDEFIVVLDNPASRAEVARLAEKIIAAIQEPMWLHDEAIQVGASVGIALNPGDGTTPTELLNNADRAMYSAKISGGRSYIFCADMVTKSASV